MHNAKCGGTTISDRLQRSGALSPYPANVKIWLAHHASFAEHLRYLRTRGHDRSQVTFISSVRDPLERARSAYIQFGEAADWEQWCVEVFCRWTPDSEFLTAGSDRPDYILTCDRTFTHQLHRLWERLRLPPMVMQRKNTTKQKGASKPDHTQMTRDAVERHWQWTFENFDFRA